MDLTVVTAASELPASLTERLEQLNIRHRLSSSLAGDSEFVLTGSDTLDPDVFEALWTKRHDAEVVIASRHKGGGRSLSRLVNRFLRRTLDLPVDDVTGPMRLYRGAALRHIELPEHAGAVASVEILVRLYNEGFKTKEVAANPASISEPGLIAILAAWARLRRLRGSKLAADADNRAFESRAPFRRRWLTERQATIVSYLEVDVPVLDVGCGTSRLVQTLSKGVGVDNTMRKLRFLRGRAKTIVGGDLERLPFRDGSFPQLVCSDVNVGASGPKLDELRRILRPHGTLVLGAPDRASLRRRLLGPFTGLGRAARLNETELRKELEDNGFRVDEVRRVLGAEMIVRAVRR